MPESEIPSQEKLPQRPKKVEEDSKEFIQEAFLAKKYLSLLIEISDLKTLLQKAEEEKLNTEDQFPLLGNLKGMIKKSASKKRPAEEETEEVDISGEGEAPTPMEKPPSKSPRKKTGARQRLEQALKPKSTETEGRQVNPQFIRSTGDVMDLEKTDPGRL